MLGSRHSIFFLISILLCHFPVYGADNLSAYPEHILDYNSVITVNSDSSLLIKEEIKISSRGQRIKHGIYRDFPTLYKNKSGRKIKVPFNVIEVKRDNSPENYTIKHLENGVRILIGNPGINLAPGEYVYTIVYSTNKQLGYFENYDELYWNVTGNDWQFPIDHAMAVIHLPTGATILQKYAYTGPFGAKGQNYTSYIDDNGNLVFETTSPLAPKEGLTVAVAWPRGYVTVPTSTTGGFLDPSNPPWGFIVVLIYYGIIWLFIGGHGRETIIPLFEPPKGISPAGVLFMRYRGFYSLEKTGMSASIIDLAVKGFVKITQKAEGCTITKLKDPESSLPEEETILMNDLFKTGNNFSFLNASAINRNEILAMISQYKTSIKNQYKQYFHSKRFFFYLGMVITFVAIANILSYVPDVDPVAWLFSVLLLSVIVGSVWTLFTNFKWSLLVGPLFLMVFFVMISFFAFNNVMLTEIDLTDVLSLLLSAVLLVVNGYFYYFLTKPTKEGEKIINDIKGFTMYLTVAEKHRLEILNAPAVTPEIFEKCLPYAIALGVEKKWQEKLISDYESTWYINEMNTSNHSMIRAGESNFGLGTILATSIVASSTPPGSSSGSGGGGSSGDGGGGGGGGGW